MIPIVFAQGQPGAAQLSFLCKALERHGGVRFLSRRAARDFGLGTPAYLLYEAPVHSCVQLHGAIVLFWQDGGLLLPPAGQTTAVYLEHTPHTQEKPPELQQIHCGMHKQTDISLTSVGETQAILSVNRSLTQLTGRELLPGECKLTYRQSVPADCLLAAGACLLLTRRFPCGVVEL